MDNSIIKEIATLGYKEKVGDIFINWENVKDEILEPERKTGTGNGTIHVFLGKEGYRLFQNEFPEYYEQVKSTNETADNAPRIRHIFSKANLISSIGHVCNYYVQKNEAEKVLNLVTKVATKLNESSDKYFFTESLFKWSTGSSDLRPYFKQFDEGFSKTIRSLLLPNSAYKICLYKNENNEYAAFWLIGFNELTDFEVESSASYLRKESDHCICLEKKLTDFILKCVEYYKGVDNLDSVVPYAAEVPINNPIKVSKDGDFSLVGMFLEADIDEIKKRNVQHSRWFENSFSLGNRTVYLSTQWVASGNYQLTLSDFEKLIKTCYGVNYYYKLGQSGEHELWKKDSAQNTTNDQTFPLQRILYGAPGTGKSFSIKSEIAKHQGIGVEKVDMEADNIFRTTFHPDYDYAQFVGCYKPTKEDSEKLTIDYKFLLDKLSEFTNNYNQTTSAFLLGLEYRSELDRVLQAEHKTYNDLFKDAGCQSTNLPTMLTAGITANDRNRVLKSQITYSFTPQVFTNALVKSYENSDESVYLVIEEINRGNCAQIFGDIFQLLDRNSHGVSEYSINIDEDLKRYLKEYFSSNDKIVPEYKDLIGQGKIKLPSNFNIIATMNTSDQSLFPMDSAFKRRWEWQYVPIKNDTKFTIKVDNDHIYQWCDFQKAVNQKILDKTFSEDKQMGDYFIKKDVTLDEFISKVMFYLWNDVCKENYHTDDNFFRTKDEKSEDTPEFSFGELMKDKAKNVIGFMNYLEVKIMRPSNPNENDLVGNDASIGGVESKI